MNNNLYHALRCAYIAGEENVPWHNFVHAVRKGMNDFGKCPPHYKDLPVHKELNEFVDHLENVRVSRIDIQPSDN